jgi:2'-hydroxyisoflavone reductase
MKLLIIGPTALAGRALLDLASQSGHEVTVLNRTSLDRRRFPLVEWIDASAMESLDRVSGMSFDCVFDLSGGLPEVSLRNALLLEGRSVFYVMLSSISVYRDFARVGLDEAYPTAEVASHVVDLKLGDFSTYGARLALCERRIAEVFPRRAAVVRAGLLAGPYDVSDRVPRLIRRVASSVAGEKILVGSDPNQPVQLLDTRDLAALMLELASTRQSGVYNAVGDATALGQVLAHLATATGREPEFTYLDDAVLARAGIMPMSQLPLWVPERGYPGFFRVSSEEARRAGLAPRPLIDTFAAAQAFLEDLDRRKITVHIPAAARLPVQAIPRGAEARLIESAGFQQSSSSAA